jgi:hypothetical protein
MSSLHWGIADESSTQASNQASGSLAIMNGRLTVTVPYSEPPAEGSGSGSIRVCGTSQGPHQRPRLRVTDNSGGLQQLIELESLEFGVKAGQRRSKIRSFVTMTPDGSPPDTQAA